MENTSTTTDLKRVLGWLVCVTASGAVGYAGYRLRLILETQENIWPVSNGHYNPWIARKLAVCRLAQALSVVALLAYLARSRIFMMIGFLALFTDPLIHYLVDAIGFVQMRVTFRSAVLGLLRIDENAAFAYQGIGLTIVLLMFWFWCKSQPVRDDDTTNRKAATNRMRADCLRLLVFIGLSVVGSVFGGLTGFYFVVVASACYLLRMGMEDRGGKRKHDILFTTALLAIMIAYHSTLDEFWDLGIHF